MWSVLGVLAGGASAAQTAVNSLMGQRVGIFVAALISSTLTTTLLALWVLPNLRGIALIDQLRGTPLPLYFGGVLGGVFIVLAMVLAPRIGVGPTTSAVVCGQIITSLVFDHLGLLGVNRVPVSAPQVVGASLLLVGTVLVVQFRHSG